MTNKQRIAQILTHAGIAPGVEFDYIVDHMLTWVNIGQRVIDKQRKQIEQLMLRGERP